MGVSWLKFEPRSQISLVKVARWLLLRILLQNFLFLFILRTNTSQYVTQNNYNKKLLSVLAQVMRLAKARLLASLVTTESVFLFLKIKVTAHSSKRKSSQLATFTRKVRDLGSNFRHEIRFAKLLPSFTTVLAIIFFICI